MFPHPQTNLDLARARHHDLTRTAARHRLRRHALRRRSADTTDDLAEPLAETVVQAIGRFGDR